METSNTAAVFWWHQTVFVVAERLEKKVRSRAEEERITVTAVLERK